MMTPQEVAEYAFTKSRLGGYNVAEVDRFMELITTDYTALYKDNAVLKNKLKVLATKLAEYRETDESIRSIVSSAQKMAESIKEEAEEERLQMLKAAEEEVAGRRKELRQEIADAEAQLAAAQDSTRRFVHNVRALIQQEGAFLDQLSQVRAEEKEEPAPAEEPAPLVAPMGEDGLGGLLSAEEMVAMAEAEAQAQADPVGVYTQELGNDQLLVVTANPDREETTRRGDFAGVGGSEEFNA